MEKRWQRKITKITLPAPLCRNHIERPDAEVVRGLLSPELAGGEGEGEEKATGQEEVQGGGSGGGGALA